MSAGVVHDDHQLLPVLDELVLSVFIETRMLSSEHSLQLLQELDEGLSSVGADPHLAKDLT